MVEDAKVAGEGRQDSASSQVEAAFGAVEGAVGLGVDIVEIERMRKILKRSPAFARKVFSAEECRYCDATAQPAVHYATRFAAKEAVLKARASSRFARPPQVGDNPYLLIEVVNDAWGRPIVKLHGLAADFLPRAKIHLSLTHDGDTAGAMVVLEDPEA